MIGLMVCIFYTMVIVFSILDHWSYIRETNDEHRIILFQHSKKGQVQAIIMAIVGLILATILEFIT